MIGHLFRVARSIVRERAKAKSRSPRWVSVRDVHLIAYPSCACCGTTKRLQVHHIKPFHLHPELELDPKNLITTCMGPFECHLKLGHGDDFKHFVPPIVKYANTVLNHPEQRAMYERAALKERLIADPLA